MEAKYDVIVVGGGNAALCAAITAADEGAKVLLLERAPEDERGGNSSYTEGLMRFVYNGSEDIFALSPDLSEEERKSDFGTYTEDKFFDDMARITQNRTDPDLCEILVRGSNPIMHWMKEKGVQIHRFPKEFLDRFEAAWKEVIAEESAKDPEVKKVWDSLSKFRGEYAIWRDLQRMN